MGFRCGIVGLPNVGKSTLFNAVTRTAAAQAANFPFTTIEPNIGEVAVSDERLDKIAAIAGSARVVPTRLGFVDIAGLVAGAAAGEGLGNRFLAHIREVDAIAHVLRCFEDPDIAHVADRIDPLADAETVETELMLADLETLERRREALSKRAGGGDKDARRALAFVDRAIAALSEGRPARELEPAADADTLAELQLLTAKPVLFVCNVDEAFAATGNQWTARVADYAAARNAGSVVISARIEAELVGLPPDERAEYLRSLGLAESGLDRLVQAGYRLLGLITFFTANANEAHAWTVPAGTRAPRAAGAVHTDFEKGFIRAQTIGYEDYVSLGGEAAAKEAGKARDEGRDYVVRDGDVILFKSNV